MFREMRREDRKINDDEVKQILENNTYGILSTMCDDGYPYGVPVSYIYLNNAIYFHGAAAGQKFDNIVRNNKVSFCVIGQTRTLPDKFSTKYESVIIFGRAIEIFDNEKDKILSEIINKYSKDYIEEGKIYIRKASKATRVIKISMEHISGKSRK
ncbi:pyridoxamine 5'-phosphate oxidase family protein [Anaerosinus massiliensis]|uniref:pyridoxamine 5'-phosphate oxidase family protein n=1 Tax=Massilibacillus massiliensis TaxID=1806837 RepID=UPI000A8AA8A9|nr:pyridoxamine 5'-phosphate oxidase family protein [Massilibacillus massiliensis]